MSNKVEQLSTGHYVLVEPAPAMVITKAQTSVPIPPAPVFIDADTGKTHINQLDPSYTAAVARAEAEGQQRGLLAAVLFGMQLCDEDGNLIDPPETGWENKLRLVGIDWEEDVKLFIDNFSKKHPDYKMMRSAMFIYYIALVGKKDFDVVVKAMGGMVEGEESGIEVAAAAFPS